MATQNTRQCRRLRTVQQRLEIVEQTRGLSASEAARLHHVSRNSIKEWRRSEDEMRRRPAASRRQPSGYRHEEVLAPLAPSAQANAAPAVIDDKSSAPAVDASITSATADDASAERFLTPPRTATSTSRSTSTQATGSSLRSAAAVPATSSPAASAAILDFSTEHESEHTSSPSATLELATSADIVADPAIGVSSSAELTAPALPVSKTAKRVCFAPTVSTSDVGNPSALLESISPAFDMAPAPSPAVSEPATLAPTLVVTSTLPTCSAPDTLEVDDVAAVSSTVEDTDDVAAPDDSGIAGICLSSPTNDFAVIAGADQSSSGMGATTPNSLASSSADTGPPASSSGTVDEVLAGATTAPPQADNAPPVRPANSPSTVDEMPARATTAPPLTDAAPPVLPANPPTSVDEVTACATSAPPQAVHAREVPMRRKRVPAHPNFAIVGYPGHIGTLADVVARRKLPMLTTDLPNDPHSFETVGFAAIEEILEAVEQHQVDLGVVPATALLSLALASPLRSFATRQLKIVGELTSTIKLCICALPGTNLLDCDCIMSDFMTFAQHASTLTQVEIERGSPMLQFAVWDNASACHTIGEERVHNAAALSTKQAAEDAGLEVLLDPVESDNPSDTSFVVFGPATSHRLRLRDDPDSTGAPSIAKATLLFGLRNQPNWLTRVATMFAQLNLQILDLQMVVTTPENSMYVWPLCVHLLPTTTNSAIAPPTGPLHSDQEHQILVSYLIVEGSNADERLHTELRSLAEWVRPLGVYDVFATEDGDIFHRRRAVAPEERGRPAFAATV